MTTREPFLTVGAIARRLNQSLHRIEYLIRSRGIKPRGWAGHARVFEECDLAFIAGELLRIDHERDEFASTGGAP